MCIVQIYIYKLYSHSTELTDYIRTINVYIYISMYIYIYISESSVDSRIAPLVLEHTLVCYKRADPIDLFTIHFESPTSMQQIIKRSKFVLIV